MTMNLVAVKSELHQCDVIALCDQEEAALKRSMQDAAHAYRLAKRALAEAEEAERLAWQANEVSSAQSRTA